MATKRDYYEVLSVQRNASEDEIRKAFRRLARQYHPDVNRESDAETRFKEINEAYEVLSNTEKRQTYDRFGHAGVNGQPGAGFGGFGGAGGFGGFEDIFETFFGGATRTRGGGRRTTRGADLRFNLSLSFEEAVFGCERTVEVPRARTCERCTGSGAEPGTQPIRCPSCSGSGEVRRVQQSIFGQFVNVTVCERCHGEGQIISTPCSECLGQGRVERVQRLSVNIPAGVDDGQQVRLTGEGEAGPNNGPAGDLYVFLSVAAHPLFKRQGQDLLYDLAINVAQAALGDEIDVPTIDGTTARVKVPSGTQTGKMVRLRDRGVPYLRGGSRGDQLIRIRVATPQELNEEQRDLFRRLARSFGTPVAGDTATARPSGDSPKRASSAATATERAKTASAPKPGAKSAKNGSEDKSDKNGKEAKDKGLFEKIKDAIGGE